MSDTDIRLELVTGEVITLRPDDTIVLTVQHEMSMDEADRIRAAWYRQAPDIRMVLLGGGVQIGAVIRAEDLLIPTD